MRKIISIIGLFLLFSCVNSETVEISKEEYSKLQNKIYIDYQGLTNGKIVVIDNCEYIMYHSYGYESITHKGNCKFCAKRLKNK